jgi:hypothetical protein
MTGDGTNAYAAAEGREFLAGELEDKDPDFVREFAGMIDDRKLLDFLNYRCSLYADVGESFLETRLGRLIVRNAGTRMADDAFRAGNVSQLKGMTGLTGQQTDDGSDLYAEAARRLEREGTIALMFGAPGSGKTATTIDIAQTWRIRTGGALIGNTDWEGFDATFSSDREMLEKMASIKGPVLALLDEVAQELSGFGSGNVEAEAFSNSMLYIRKREEEYGPYPKKGSILATSHTRTKTARCIRLIGSFAVSKFDRDNPDKARLLESESDSDDWDEVATYQGLTDTAAAYDEYDPSGFEIIEGVGDDDQEDAPDVEEEKKTEHIKTAVKAHVLRGMKYEDIADIVPYTDWWVGERVREYKRGERPDLKAEIEGETE